MSAHRTLVICCEIHFKPNSPWNTEVRTTRPNKLKSSYQDTRRILVDSLTAKKHTPMILIPWNKNVRVKWWRPWWRESKRVKWQRKYHQHGPSCILWCIKKWCWWIIRQHRQHWFWTNVFSSFSSDYELANCHFCCNEQLKDDREWIQMSLASSCEISVLVWIKLYFRAESS